jgi:hypothetical protein
MKLQKHDKHIIYLAETLNQLMPLPDENTNSPIGFQTEAEDLKKKPKKG